MTIDILPTTTPTEEQKECAAAGHSWRDGCHCDGGGWICRACGFHAHF